MLLKKTLITIIATAALALGQAAQAPQKNWKDQAEFTLASGIPAEKNPATRLQTLDKWKAAYPGTEFASERQQMYLATYAEMNNHRAAFDLAAEMLKADPNNLAAIQEVLGYGLTLMPQQANAQLSAQNKTDLDIIERTGRYLIANADALFAADKMPPGSTAAQWTAAKPAMQGFAQFTVARVAVFQKDNPKAETELTKTLQMSPTNAVASQLLIGALLGQQAAHPEKVPLALFQYARAATYDGPGSLDAATRNTLNTSLTKAYTLYHGSTEGLEQLKAMARVGALPAADMKMKSTVQIAQEKAEADAAAAAANPMMALWRSIKTELTGDNGPAYFDSSVKDAGLPGGVGGVTKFKAKLVSATPETRPKELTVAVEDAEGKVADVTLKFDEPLPGKMDAGGEISFSGTVKAYDKTPYMLTFETAAEDIEGWTGKNAPGRGGAATKKAPAPAKKK